MNYYYTQLPFSLGPVLLRLSLRLVRNISVATVPLTCFALSRAVLNQGYPTRRLGVREYHGVTYGLGIRNQDQGQGRRGYRPGVPDIREPGPTGHPGYLRDIRDIRNQDSDQGWGVSARGSPPDLPDSTQFRILSRARLVSLSGGPRIETRSLPAGCVRRHCRLAISRGLQAAGLGTPDPQPHPQMSPICRGSGVGPGAPPPICRGSGVHPHPHPRFARPRIGDQAEYH